MCISRNFSLNPNVYNTKCSSFNSSLPHLNAAFDFLFVDFHCVRLPTDADKAPISGYSFLIISYAYAFISDNLIGATVFVFVKCE